MLDDPSAFTAWLRDEAGWAVPLTFLIAFLESFPIVSLVVPSTALLLGMGALVGAGLVEPWPLLIACAVGGILGDAAGYFLARAIGGAVIRRRLPRKLRRHYARCILLFRRWGWWAVFLGRFIGPLRAIAPLAAGVSGMRNLPFQTANILSALIWAPLVLMPGAAGAWLAQQIGPQAQPVVLVVAVGATVLILRARARRRMTQA